MIYLFDAAQDVPKASNLSFRKLTPNSVAMGWQMNDIGIDFEPVKKYVIIVDKLTEDGSPVQVGKYRTSSNFTLSRLTLILINT